MSEAVNVLAENIQNRIFTVRGLQVMLDIDLAVLYGVETKRINEQVKRNIERFPQEFCFQLTTSDIASLRSQNATSSWGGRRYLPYVFTEQGVAMLSAVIKSETAVRVSVHIMNAFVAMRRFLLSNAQVFQRLDSLEIKQIHTDQKIDIVLTAIEKQGLQPKQGIFYDGQVFDAWQFVSGVVRSARKSILLIDNYVDDTVLTLFAKRRKAVTITIFVKTITKQLELDVKKFNAQYEQVQVREFSASHDRFLIVDETDVYHLGASLKDLGKKWFAFSKMDMSALGMLEKLKP